MHDVTQAPTLLTGQRSDYAIAHKSIDAVALIELIEAQGAVPIIPARCNRKPPALA